MQKTTILLTILGFLSSTLYSQREEPTTLSDNPRSEKQFAISLDMGAKSMAGTGIAFTYYQSTNIALDAGVGIGIQGFKGGIRARYLLLQKNFTPYVGLGVYAHPTQVVDLEFISLELLDPPYFVTINRTVFGQLLVGFEYIAERGFLIGLNLGYSVNFNSEPWISDVATEIDINFLNLLYGSGISAGFTIGYAF